MTCKLKNSCKLYNDLHCRTPSCYIDALSSVQSTGWLSDSILDEIDLCQCALPPEHKTAVSAARVALDKAVRVMRFANQAMEQTATACNCPSCSKMFEDALREIDAALGTDNATRHVSARSDDNVDVIVRKEGGR